MRSRSRGAKEKRCLVEKECHRLFPSLLSSFSLFSRKRPTFSREHISAPSPLPSRKRERDRGTGAPRKTKRKKTKKRSRVAFFDDPPAKSDVNASPGLLLSIFFALFGVRSSVLIDAGRGNPAQLRPPRPSPPPPPRPRRPRGRSPPPAPRSDSPSQDCFEGAPALENDHDDDAITFVAGERARSLVRRLGVGGEAALRRQRVEPGAAQAARGGRGGEEGSRDEQGRRRRGGGGEGACPGVRPRL